MVVSRTISSWVLVLRFILGIVSGDSKPFHRWSWHRVDHMASRHLLEDTFVAQPSVQGSPPSSSPSIISYLTFELQPTSSASASTDIPSCRRIASSSSRPSQEESRLAFLKVCNISGGGALFDWNDAKASTIVLLDDTPLFSGCRVHIGIAQLPVVLQHRVVFSSMAEQGRTLAGEGARIECRVSEIWQTTNPDAGDEQGIPSKASRSVTHASSAACVTERFGFHASFVARSTERTRAPSETANAARRFRGGAGRGRARSAKELHAEDRARHVLADISSSELWSTGLTLRIALTSDVFGLFATRPFRDGVDTVYPRLYRNFSGFFFPKRAPRGIR